MPLIKAGGSSIDDVLGNGFGGFIATVLGAIRNPTLVMTGSCGHCPQIENPQAFTDIVDGFLDQNS